MSSVDIIVIIIFTLLVVGCGISFAGSGKNMKSYFSAGGALPWWMSGLSLFMSFFSAGTFVVWGSIAYQHGWVAVTIQWTMCLAGVVIGFFIAPKWQKTRVLTAAEYISERLGERVKKVYTSIFLTIATFSTGTFLYPVAKIVEVSTGLPITNTIIGLGLLILLYTAVGGLWAVIVTDILQFVVLTAAVLVVVPLALQEIGGISNFINKAPENFFSLTGGEYTWSFIFAFALYNLFFIAGNWAYIQRYTCVATPQDAKKVGWLFGGLYLISPVIWMIAPMVYRVLNPDIAAADNEGAYLLMCKEVLPVGMLGLMLGGMIFATSSSINTALNITAGVITNDVIKPLYPKLAESKLVKIGRLTTVLLGLVTITIALLVPYMGGVVEVVMTMAALTGGALFLPPIWLLFSKYQCGFSILTTSILTLSINAYFKFISPWLFELSLSRAEEMLLGVTTPVILLVLFELYYRATKQVAPRYAQYKQLESLKQQAEKEGANTDSGSNNAANTKGNQVIGFGILFTGLILICLAILAEKGNLVVALMASIVTLIGTWLIFKNKTADVEGVYEQA
ncbi:sodium:solute symporter family protein [Catenovulum maritimum]|uniref:Sodium transporter n=1 Tax=Catenovulum maritimum TaxID=1513271 RepID=A0A0J8GW13_9ALTE|nr:sodium:solute symporter family protein [Catenovulum maritimum]KMT66952.1 sodium transporter [Catenovulum maritimum]